MKKSFLIFVSSLFSILSYSQFIYKIKGDSVLITNDSCTAELNLENVTKNVKGFLYNKGNGRTEFRKGLIKVNDSVYLIGADTLRLNGGSGGSSSSAWSLTGNSGTNPSTNFLGTIDSTKLIFKTSNTQRASVFADGTINIGPNDTASRPLFRIYPNGDFSVKAKNNLTGNVFGPNNGIRYNSKYGVLEVGTGNNFDTNLSVSCCGSQLKSAIVINSDFICTFKGHIHGSIIGGDNMTVDTAGNVSWSSVFGEAHYINSIVNKSTINGYGNTIRAQIYGTTIVGSGNQITKPVTNSIISGYFNSPVDTVNISLVSGAFNNFGGIGQTVSGVNLTNKTPYGSVFGNKNVIFTSLNYIGYQQSLLTENISNLDKYPLFSLGNSKYFGDTSYTSNALTVLFNGRTQINTTGFGNDLSEADVTPKAALEVVSKNSGILIPKLTTGQRDSIISNDLINGLLLYNTDSNKFQFYNGSYWKTLCDSCTGGGGGLADPGNNGIVVRTALNTTTNRTLTGTTNKIDITNGDGVSGNPTINVGSDVVQLTSTQTLTNKTVTLRVSTLTDGANISVNSDNGDVFTVTLGGNRTIDNPSGTAVNGQFIEFRLRQDGTGSRTISWGSAYRFGTDITGTTLSTTPAKNDYIKFQYNSTDSKWDCVAFVRGY